jgi:hypothetical protein
VAVLKFLLYDLEENEFEVDDIISYEISKDIDAVCDGVRLTFVVNKTLGEINRVEIYNDGKRIFNGYADTQREYMSSDGYECFIYARSSACVLLDNTATPFTYIRPSARTLFVKNARELGYKYGLPEICCESSYQVSKGTSCFGAINNFVYGLTGKSVMINVDDELVLAQSDDEVNLNDYDIISEKRVINRGNVITAVDYKLAEESDYQHHIKSRFFEDKKISRSVKINVSSLPEWQKSYVLKNTLESAGLSYNTIELVINGCVDVSLYSNATYSSEKFGDMDGYYISSVCIINDSNGERTKLEMSKKIDLKEITYVAK